jgi:hypothetical protein
MSHPYFVFEKISMTITFHIRIIPTFSVLNMSINGLKQMDLSLVRHGMNNFLKPKVSHILSNIVLITDFSVHYRSHMTHELRTVILISLFSFFQKHHISHHVKSGDVAV